MKTYLIPIASLASVALVSSPSFATLPDNGFGTIDMPAHAPYVPENDVMMIIDGLPSGTMIECDTVLTAPFSTQEAPGGTLGGTVATGTGMFLDWSLQGTGLLSGFSRPAVIPLSNVVVHTAPRTPGNPVQSFDTDMFVLQGQLPPGDPDFDLLRVTAGTGFGMPSPGHTTLSTAGPGNWHVDSFFDITYRIDFVGNPGGPLAGRSGSTTGTIRMILPEPASLSALAGVGLIALRRRSRA